MKKLEPGAPSGLEAMVELTQRLTDLLADQARAFERHRPQDAAANLAEVARLTNLYRAGSAKVRAEPNLASDATPEVRRRLLRATEAFEAVLERQTRALTASKTVAEGLVKAIAEAIDDRRSQNAGYGPGAARKSAATSIALNQQA